MIVERQDNAFYLGLVSFNMKRQGIEGYWLKEFYYFYSKKEAIKLFKNLKKEIKQLNYLLKD
jgi:N-glycosylase/DNA lyase